MSDKIIKCFIILLSFSKQEQLKSVLSTLAQWYPSQNRQEWLTYGFTRTSNFSGEYFFNSVLDNPEKVLDEINDLFIRAGFTTVGPYPICHQCPE